MIGIGIVTIHPYVKLISVLIRAISGLGGRLDLIRPLVTLYRAAGLMTQFD